MNWNHWVWARQAYDDYVLLLFPMTASRKYGYREFPIVFVQDAEGNIVFQSTEGGTVELLGEYTDDKTGKPYPSKVRYTATENGMQLTYTLEKKDVLQSEDAMALAPAPLKSVFKLAGLQPSYARFLGEGEMRMELPNCENAIERKADLIYEFMYPGKTYKVK